MKECLCKFRVELVLIAMTLSMLAVMEACHPYFFLQDDNRSLHLPYYVHNLRALLGGELPLFNFNQYLGTPVSFFSAPFYPINYAAMFASRFFLGHYFGTMEFIAAIHLVAAALGFYRFAKELSLGDAAGFFGGVAWAFSPFVITIGNSWIHTLGGAAWLPWILLFSSRQIGGWTAGDFLRLLLVRLLALLLAFPQWFLYTAVFELLLLSALYVTAGDGKRSGLARLACRQAAGYLALLALAFPFIQQLLRESGLSFARSSVLSWREYVMFPYRIPEWLHGIFTPFTASGRHHLGELDFVSHVGYLTLLCAIFALFHCRNREYGTRIIIFTLLALLAFLWSADIIFTKIFYYLPLFNKMRYPFKLQLFTGFFMVTVAAFGFELAGRLVREKAGRGWKVVLFAVLVAHAANFMLLYTLLPQRMISNHLDVPPFAEPLKDRLGGGRIVSAGPDAVLEGERAVPGNSVPTLGYNFAMLWGLFHFGGYEALLSRRNHDAALGLINNSIFNVADGTALDFSADVPLDYLRKWGVSWYVVNSRVPVAGVDGLVEVYADSYRKVFRDPAARPLVYWQDSLKSDSAAFLFRVNSVEIATSRGEAGVLTLNVLFHPFFRGYLDGSEVPVAETGEGQMSLDVPPGEHKVIFRYVDSSFRKGVIASAILLVSALLVWLWIQSRGRVRSSS